MSLYKRESVLYYLCSTRKSDSVQNFIKKNPKIFITSPNILSRAFSIACTQGDEELVNLLLEQSGKIDWNHGLTYACTEQHSTIIKIVLKNAMQTPGYQINWDWRLSYACVMNHIDVINILIEYAAQASYPLDWSAAFTHACEHGHLEAAEIIVAHGTQINLNLALEMASINKHVATVDYILRLGECARVSIEWNHVFAYIDITTPFVPRILTQYFNTDHIEADFIQAGYISIILNHNCCPLPKLLTLLPQYTDMINGLIADYARRQVLIVEYVPTVLAGMISEYVGYE